MFTFCKRLPTVAGPCLRKNTSWLVEQPSNIATSKNKNAAAPSLPISKESIDATMIAYV